MKRDSIKAVGTIWKCIDTESEMFFQNCIIKEVDTNPDHNGDGTIELLYDDGSTHCGKVRRFVPDITHVALKR